MQLQSKSQHEHPCCLLLLSKKLSGASISFSLDFTLACLLRPELAVPDSPDPNSNLSVCCEGVSAVNRTITANAVEARLSLSKTMLDFGSQIVLRSNQVKPPYSLDVVLTSNEASETAWQMGAPSCEGLEGCGGVFTMDPTSGTLAKVGQTSCSLGA